jgi:predicted tellurium resistance membrane protein TerC
VKSTIEIHEKLEGEDGHSNPKGAVAGFAGVIIQIMFLDIIFSLDSVITAVGMAQHLAVMITAVILAMGVMLMAAGAISDFVNRHPTLKMLALSFLILIGVTLVAEGTGMHVPKGYVYFAMAFSFGVEMLNLKLRKKTKPVELHQPYR